MVEYQEVPRMPMYNVPQQMQPPAVDKDFDQIESYGSIIKDLTDTEKFLLAYELRLVGKMMVEGNEVTDTSIKPVIKDREIAKYLVDMIRSVANQNTHFSGFESADVDNTLRAFNYTINRWLMLQGKKVPLRYRQKLSLEAMNICKASLHKALKHIILTWSKGNIREAQQLTTQPQQESKGGLLNFVFGKGKYRYKRKWQY